VQDIARFSVLQLTPTAARVLRGEETVSLARPRIREKVRKKAPARVPGLERAEDTALFEELRALRKRLADERGVPPYVIFGDAALLEMSVRRPANESEFLEISGVGQVKLERHGSDFLATIAAQRSVTR
jgi:ATP-dependent DNA helicase RecQ